MPIKIIPIAYDSFSTRSMATIIKTDITIFIDPSVAIGPRRYNLPPHPIELEELDSAKERILKWKDKVDIIILTHYHWDHTPHPDSKHFDILKSKDTKLIIKDPKNHINRSQFNRALNVLRKLNEKRDDIFIGDSNYFEFNNTYIQISNPVWHGEENSPLGYVIMAKISYKIEDILFASDIQGFLNKKVLKEVISLDPSLIIMSGPPTYHPKWDNKLYNVFIENLNEIANKTKIKEIIIDHHAARDINYLKNLEIIRNNLKEYGIQVKSASNLINEKPKLLEANRKNLYKNYPK